MGFKKTIGAISTSLELLAEEAWREYTQTVPIGIGGFGSWNGNWLY